MSMRDLLRDKPAAGVAVFIAIIVLAGWIAFGRSRGEAPIGRWYYDLSSGDLVVFNPRNAAPPVKLPSGNDGVLAHVYGCGDCSGKTFIGYLEKYLVAAAPASGSAMGTPGKRMVAVAPAGSKSELQWHDANSSAGMTIQTDAGKTCTAAPARECTP